MKLDLHTHTTYSDGELNIEGNVAKAIEQGLDAIAITDHDNIESWAEIDSNTYKIPVIKGLELSTYHKDDVVHVLGYYLNDGGDYSGLEAYLKKTQLERKLRMEKMLKLLENYDIYITEEEVLKETTSVIGRPHIAAAIMKKYPERGYTRDSIFDNLIGNNAPCFVPVNRYSTKEGIELLKRNHCLTVIAHPLNIKKFDYKELKELNPDGIECFYKYRFMTSDEVLKFALKNNLIKTGGSDYHGPNVRDTIGKSYLEDEQYMAEFLKRINKKI